MTYWNNMDYGIMPAMWQCERCGSKRPTDTLVDGLCSDCREDHER